MKKVRNGFVKNLRYLCLVGVVALGLISIVGSNGGGDIGGGGGGGGAGDIGDVGVTWMIDCAASGVSTVEGKVYDENNSYLVGDSWPCSYHQGTVHGVPVGSDRKLVVTGEDSSGNVLYRGEVTGITVTAGQTTSVDTMVLSFEPTLSAPADGSTVAADGFSFEWDSVTGAAEYRIQVSEDSTFSTTVIDDTVSETTYTPSGFSDGTIYYWRVKVIDSFSNESAWSEVWSVGTY